MLGFNTCPWNKAFCRNKGGLLISNCFVFRIRSISLSKMPHEFLCSKMWLKNNTLECSLLALSGLPISHCVSFTGEFRQISTWKIWFRLIQRLCDGKNDPNSPNLEDLNFYFFSNQQIFYDNLQQCIVKNRQGFFFPFFFLLSCLVCSQNWLNIYSLDDHHFGYITKSLKVVFLLLPNFLPNPSVPEKCDFDL